MPLGSFCLDFNQAMDARLVTPEIADLLAKVKWIKRIRFGCDTQAQIGHCERAISLIDKAGTKESIFSIACFMERLKNASIVLTTGRTGAGVIFHTANCIWTLIRKCKRYRSGRKTLHHGLISSGYSELVSLRTLCREKDLNAVNSLRQNEYENKNEL